MPYLQPFDPWGSKLCTCPPKWSLNPYTGCGHRCLYCYASSFIPRFYEPRPKKDFLRKIERELEKLPENSIISLSNSSDPYQPLEEKFRLTREFIIRLTSKKVKLLIITKSDLILRDLDILSKLEVVIALTLTSKSLSKILEPGAPSYEKRLNALKEIKKRGFKTVVRIDPLIPEINLEEAKEVLYESLPYADHFVLSTYKAKADSLERLCKAFKERELLLKRLYLKEGIFVRGSRYLPLEIRRKILLPFIEVIEKTGKSYALCREGLKEYATKKGFCDGSFLLFK
ncbi:MAG: radical SAM protein [Caldimicrobium thiodismutans]|uniref:Radical SAM protein n=1 Tax=Caldimicrobium thiodismutans TaxID=1653476 RepID=A0A2N7PII9_9BACT|nr:MAG: radical SAM protein [Caldimicrobium thiodismutans]